MRSSDWTALCVACGEAREAEYELAQSQPGPRCSRSGCQGGNGKPAHESIVFGGEHGCPKCNLVLTECKSCSKPFAQSAENAPEQESKESSCSCSSSSSCSSGGGATATATANAAAAAEAEAEAAAAKAAAQAKSQQP
jgi:hypothetical protein